MKVAEMETKLGRIVVHESGFTEEGYPGYFISLVNFDDKVLAETLFEVDQTEAPTCKVHVWDCSKDEPVFSFAAAEDSGGLKFYEQEGRCYV